ncbi:MAG: CDP-alcohol phosphatidyltransferase family protein, partial [Litorimonas sp.]
MQSLPADLTPDLSITSTKTVGQRVAANTGLMMGSKFLGALFGAVSLLLAAKHLDTATFGIVLFLHAYMLFFAEVATFHSWQSIIRFGTNSVKDNEHEGLCKILNFGVRLDFMAAIFGFLLSISVFYFGAFIVSSASGLGELSANMETSKPYIMGYCLLVIMSQRGASIGIFRLFDKFYVLAIKSLIMPAVRLVGVIIAAYMDAGLKGFVLAWFAGSFCAYTYIPIMAIIELKRRRLLHHVIKAKVNFRKPGAGVWNFVIKTNLDSTLGAANLHLPMILVFGVFGASWAAVYKIAEEIAKILSEGYILLDQVIYPELAKMVSLGQADKIWRLVTRAAVILLSMGLSLSAVIMLVGPEALSRLLSTDYSASAPLMSLLVPAAALMGVAAPLYPVFYASSRPERAIFVRGTGVLIYIISFFIFAATIGEMAPGWAALLGNGTAVVLVVIMAKYTLGQDMKGLDIESSVQGLDAKSGEHDGVPEAISIPPVLNIIGQSPIKLWGLPLRDWQERAFKKAGAVQDTAHQSPNLHISVQYVLSSPLAKAFVARRNIALVNDGVIIGINGVDVARANDLIGQPVSAIEGTGLSAVSPHDLDDGYVKALRKNEPPYVVDVHATPVNDLQKRQFASSYKGITDFVTKWFWPVPAFYVTRLCAALRLTPNMVTTVGLVLTFLAMYYFWQGQWALGFAAGWMMTFLDTVDGKLARTTMTYSWWGNIYDHGIDLVHPPFWYFAWYIG